MKRVGWISGVLLGVLLAGGGASPAAGESPTGESLVKLREVSVEPLKEGIAVLIKTTGAAAYQTAMIDTPTRLIIDLESTDYGWRRGPLTVAMEPLRSIRGSQFKKGVARVVLELSKVVGYRIDDGPEGITVLLESPVPSPRAEAVPAPVAAAAPAPRRAEARPQARPAPPPPASEAAAPPKVEPAPAAKAPEPQRAARPPVVAMAPPPAAAPPAPPVRVAQAAPAQPAPGNGQRTISLDFKDADVVNLLRILAFESGRNIVAGEDVKGKISISLRDVSWELALETILEARGLQKVEKDGVIRVVSIEQLTKEREARARAEEAKRKGEAEARAKEAEAQLKEAEAKQRQLAAEAAIAEAQARGPLKEETIRLKYADPDEVVATLEGILGIPRGGGAPGGAQPLRQPGVTPAIGLGGAPPIAEPPFSALYGPQAAPGAPGAVVSASAEVLAKGITIRAHKPTNTIFIRHYAADLERIKKLINETLDVPVPQVKIEARMEILDRPSLFEIGVQWGGAGTKRAGQNLLVGQGLLSNAGLVDQGRTDGISPGPAPIFEPGSGFNPNLPLGALLPIAAATGLPTGGNFVSLPTTGGASTRLPAGGIQFGIVGTRFNLNLALTALERLEKSKSLARPEIVTVENKPAQMSLGEEIPYQSVSSAGTQVQFKEAVLKLEVTPTVIREADGTRIKMRVVVENNSRGALLAGVPAINKRRAETEVVVKEGEVLVIGGVSQRQILETVSKVPFFGDIPLIGWLFKRKTSEIDPDRELVVFITPSVIKGGSPIPVKQSAADKPPGS
jgi:type IV pilus assembly protein PilQ